MEVLRNTWWTGQVGTRIIFIRQWFSYTRLFGFYAWPRPIPMMSSGRGWPHTPLAHFLKPGLVAIHQLLLHLYHGFCDAQCTIVNWYFEPVKTIFLQIGITLASTKKILVGPKATQSIGWHIPKESSGCQEG